MVVATLPGCLDPQLLITTNGVWIDVQDIASAHIASIEKEAAGGERIIVTAGAFVWHEWSAYLSPLGPEPRVSEMVLAGIINALDPSLLPNGKPVREMPKVDKVLIRRYDATKAEGILGIKLTPMQETAKAIMEDVAKRGWLGAEL
jgi:nucleoside-diphosphate-sugar epimerase